MGFLKNRLANDVAAVIAYRTFATEKKAILSILFPHVYLRQKKMESHQLKNIHVIPEKKCFQEFSKASYPIRYGRFSEILTVDSRHVDYETIAMIEFTALKAQVFSCFRR